MNAQIFDMLTSESDEDFKLGSLIMEKQGIKWTQDLCNRLDEVAPQWEFYLSAAQGEYVGWRWKKVEWYSNMPMVSVKDPTRILRIEHGNEPEDQGPSPL